MKEDGRVQHGHMTEPGGPHTPAFSSLQHHMPLKPFSFSSSSSSCGGGAGESGLQRSVEQHCKAIWRNPPAPRRCIPAAGGAWGMSGLSSDVQDEQRSCH
jgi:hypothetical protein